MQLEQLAVRQHRPARARRSGPARPGRRHRRWRDRSRPRRRRCALRVRWPAPGELKPPLGRCRTQRAISAVADDARRPNSSGSRPGRKRTPKISRPPTPMPPTTHQDRTQRAARPPKDWRAGTRRCRAPGPPAMRAPGARRAWLRAWAAAARCGRRRRSGRCLLLPLPLDLPPARDVAIVLVDVVREGVPALAVGDEVQRALARRGRDRRQDRGAARIADRPGRQAGHDVGVVGRARLQVGARQLAALHALAAGHAVDRGRIALQPHPDSQAIDVDRRHLRPLGRYRRSPSR